MSAILCTSTLNQIHFIRRMTHTFLMCFTSSFSFSTSFQKSFLQNILIISLTLLLCFQAASVLAVLPLGRPGLAFRLYSSFPSWCNWCFYLLCSVIPTPSLPNNYSTEMLFSEIAPEFLQGKYLPSISVEMPLEGVSVQSFLYFLHETFSHRLFQTHLLYTAVTAPSLDF